MSRPAGKGEPSDLGQVVAPRPGGFVARAPIAWACLLVASALGCEKAWSGPSPQVAKWRSKFLRATEPAGATSLAEVRKREGASSGIVLVGQVGVPGQNYWIDGKAAFLIREVTNEDPAGHGGEGHDPANCPFCRRKASQAASTAIVQFLDQRGQIIGIDARELFELTDNQRVVVQGTAQVVEPDLLVITAWSLFMAPQ